tara:strand:- start:62 stop:415 length:354 start_codon:yes stop_codon:yes gene_type:complete
MPIILRLLAAGVPAAKIISKYGKAAYINAKKIFDIAKKKGVPKLTSPLKKRDIKLDKAENKFIKDLVKDVKKGDIRRWNRKYRRWDLVKDVKKGDIRKKGGKIKTYARGSIVRKVRI